MAGFPRWFNRGLHNGGYTREVPQRSKAKEVTATVVP